MLFWSINVCFIISFISLQLHKVEDLIPTILGVCVCVCVCVCVHCMHVHDTGGCIDTSKGATTTENYQ